MLPQSFLRPAAVRSARARRGRLVAFCAWAACLVALGPSAFAQTENIFGHVVPVRTARESIQPVRLLGIEPIGDETGRNDERVPPATNELDLLSSEHPTSASVNVPRHCGEFPDVTTETLFGFRDDLRRCLPVLRDDAVGVVNWNNAAVLGGALGAAIGFRQGLDEDVRDYTAEHPDRWGHLSKTLGNIGDVQYQVPVLLGVYAYSLHRQDKELHAMTASLLSAYTISGLTTISIKAIANTDRPSEDWNDGEFGFPSFHTSSSFSIASVLDEYYGPKVGLPAYAVAGLIGWSRIDERDHDLSDVVFGAALGFVIGKSVARRHLDGDSRVRLLPYVHPTEGTGGLMLDIAY